jgi:putative ABC transport system substrate-binding protein
MNIFRRASAIATLLICLVPGVEAQQAPVKVVGVLHPQRLEHNPAFGAFAEALRQLGYQEGVNLRLLVRSAEGVQARLPALAAELVAAQPDAILAVNTPGTSAAIRATRRIPIVFAAVGDPLGSGFVSNLARPEGNVTGISNVVAELSPKRLNVLKELVPGARRISALFNPEDPVTAPQIRAAERVAPALNIEIRFFPVRRTEELPQAFRDMAAWRTDAAIWLAGQNHLFQDASVKLAAGHRIPLMVGLPPNVQAGGLVSYSGDPEEAFRRAAVYVDRILKGAKPADLPVEQSTKFILAINRKTANALGIAIPASLLIQADRVVE